jgi:hypothetical protein
MTTSSLAAASRPIAETRLDGDRLIAVLATVGLNVLVVGLLVFVPTSNWRTGLALNLIDNLILIAYTIFQKDRLVARLLLFGLIVGIVELPTDAWIVDVTRTLDYGWGGGPMIWRSPVWMPLAWQIVAVQFGYIGLRLSERLGGIGVVLCGVLGAINIPYYEQMALRIHWWRYHDAVMVPHTQTPWAIVIGELFIAMAIALCARAARRDGWLPSGIAGVFAGISIFPAYAVPYTILHW